MWCVVFVVCCSQKILKFQAGSEVCQKDCGTTSTKKQLFVADAAPLDGSFAKNLIGRLFWSDCRCRELSAALCWTLRALKVRLG